MALEDRHFFAVGSSKVVKKIITVVNRGFNQQKPLTLYNRFSFKVKLTLVSKFFTVLWNK